jgi:3-deoxy-D-manno-octulosonate 8-phosphate phosphatase (KDO 8-P phosphatase)
MTSLIQQFLLEGAQLNASVSDIRQKLTGIRAFLFDWDGVFNNGEKFGDQGSPFSEADSMGTNLLRLGYWLRHDHKMPVTGIITGAINQGVDYFAKRECLDVCIRGFTDKQIAWKYFLENFDIQPHEVAFVFDDVIDLPIAKECGLRFCINRKASPAFKQYVIENNLCEYVTANTGGEGAVREVCEFMLSIQGLYDDAVDARMEYAEDGYARYLADRKGIQTLTLVP